jgi:hypothetical protein
MLQSLGLVVTRIVEMAEASTAKGSADRTLATLCDLNLSARLDRDYGVIYAKAAAFLRRALKADAVRISAVEPDSPFLRSLAFRQITCRPNSHRLMIAPHAATEG